MKMRIKYSAVYILNLVFVLAIFSSCTKDKINSNNKYTNILSFNDNSQIHLKNDIYSSIINKYIDKGIIGTSVYIKDSHGTWLGAGGSADIASNIPVNVSNQFMIASISKIFTATVIYTLIDEGKLSIDDPISKWIDESIIDKIENADIATIKHLLSHTSGIRDFYTVPFEMARYNVAYNNWSQEEVLDFVYNKNATFPVGESYSYSNTNYLLLGMIIENINNSTLKEAYYNRIFNPLGLNNAFYDIKENTAPSGLINGYYNLYGKGYVHSDFLYKDELGSGDGGIVINAQDLGVFFDALMDGQILSASSHQQMQDWFDIDNDRKNGYGLEYFTNDYGISYGHSGGADGFISVAHYYPAEDATIIILFNFTPSNELNDITFDFINAISDAVLK